MSSETNFAFNGFNSTGTDPQILTPKTMVGDSGSGGVAGTVPAPAAGDAAAGKFLKANGVWVVPAVGTGSPLTTKGDIYTFDTASARLAVGSNGQVLTADSSQTTGVKWATPSSGSSLCPVLTKPVSTDFTWTNQLSTTVTDTTPGMFFDMPSNATDPNFRLFKYNTALPSTPYSVVLGFNAIIGDSSYADVDISLLNSSNGKFVCLDWNMAGSDPLIRLLQFNSVTSVATVVNRSGKPRSGILSFFKITDDGTNRKYWYSPDGFNYWLVASEATNTFVTPDTACIGCANFTGGTRQFTVWHWQVVNAII